MKKLLLLFFLVGNVFCSDDSIVSTVFDFLDLSYVDEVREQDRMLCGTSDQFDEFVLNIDDAKIKWLKDLTKKMPTTFGQSCLGTPKDNDKSFFMALRYIRALQALKQIATTDGRYKNAEDIRILLDSKRNTYMKELGHVWKYYSGDSLYSAYLGSLEQTAILDFDKRAELLEFYKEKQFLSYPNLKSRVIYWSSFA